MATSEHVGFRLDRELAERIDDLAEDMGQEQGRQISRPAVIVMLVKRGLDDYEKEKGIT